jgi:hypothetical protein
MIVTEVNEGDALGAWNILLRKYERNTAASRNQLRRELHTLRLGTTESVDEYKARAMHIAARLRATKEVVSDGEVQYCLLEGLPAAYDVVRQALEVQDIVDLETTCIHLREVEDKLSRRSRDDEAERTNKRGPRATAAAVGAGFGPGGEELIQMMRAAAGYEAWPRGESAGGRGSEPQRRCLVCNGRSHSAWTCTRRQKRGCFRCGGRHSVRDCHEEFVVDDSASDGESGEERGRPATPGPGGRR